MGYIKAAIDLLNNPPTCPVCGKRMKAYAAGGFFEAIEQTIDIICCGNVKFICLSKVQNEKYQQWKTDKKKYNKEMAEYQKKCNSTLVQMGLKRPPKPPKPLPTAPKQIPCKNHYKLEVKGGDYNEKIVKKRKKPTFNSEGSQNPGLF